MAKVIDEQQLMAGDVDAPVPCRMVTADEIAHYLEFGWVKLEKFINPQVLHDLLAIAKDRMGEDGDSNDPYGRNVPYFNAEYGNGLGNPKVRPLMNKVAESAKLLMNRALEVEVRYFTDVFVPKLPSGKKTRNEGNGATGFHQDFITFAVDRSGGMTFWIPLEPYGPESGTLSFVNGSHRMGALGNFLNYGGGDALDVFPELRELGLTDPMEYELGDVTVHSHMMIHGAGKNVTDTPRWAYLITVNPADAVWTGAPPEAFDTTGMTPWEGFDDDRFPILT